MGLSHVKVRGRHEVGSCMRRDKIYRSGARALSDAELGGQLEIPGATTQQPGATMKIRSEMAATLRDRSRRSGDGRRIPGAVMNVRSPLSRFLLGLFFGCALSGALATAVFVQSHFAGP